MSRTNPNLAPHVAAAIARATGNATAQPRDAGTPNAPAPHVAAAIETGAVQRRAAPGAAAAHVHAAVSGAPTPAAQARTDPAGDGDADAKAATPAAPALHAVTDYVVYRDVKSGAAPPPPPRRPIYAMSCVDGAGCALRDVKTGRVRAAEDVFGGFVRMAKGGPVYVSPRADVGAPGDSHPSIASGTPEWQAGERAVVAAGEVGILGGEIVGHNDKTGHFLSRKNRLQSGMPAERYHPFTEDPREWYRR